VNVPFADLRAQYLSIRSDIDAAITAVLQDCGFIGGKHVRSFDENFAREYGVSDSVGVANGTDAIYVVLRMLGLGSGDEVLVPANSWISTSEAVTQAGAKPVFVDVDESFNLDPAQAEARIGPHTRAVIAVHLFGQPAQMDAITTMCRRHELLLIEDCAQAHFARFGGQNVGTFGVAGTFSFYPGKNLGAYGDAGAIVTNDGDLATRCRMYANHGSLRKHEHMMEGINSRLDGLQAAILDVKLRSVRAWNQARIAHAATYDRLLARVPQVCPPTVGANRTHVFHLYVIRAPRRDALRDFLTSRGVQTGIHYPRPLPFLEAYRHLGHTAADFPVAARNQSEMLSLPMYAELSEDMIAYVVDCIAAFYERF
jgi:dTDP-4-amino-4,6-dideoxygalactose transaminase